jgi:hypothetical protein
MPREAAHPEADLSGVGFLIGLFPLPPLLAVRPISKLSGCNLSVSPPNSLDFHPPLPPKLAIPPPSAICASTSSPVLLITPVRSLGVAERALRSGNDRPPVKTFARLGSIVELEIAVAEVAPVCADVV